ncbi:MAG: hypothetical protein ACE5FJ_12435 [Gemmatimonadales bacterium]
MTIPGEGFLGSGANDRACYEWGELFASPWPLKVETMGEKAAELGFDDANVAVPVTFVVVKQPDPTDDRGDIIFDIFLMSYRSYLWHFNRVFTQPSTMPPDTR